MLDLTPILLAHLFAAQPVESPLLIRAAGANTLSDAWSATGRNTSGHPGVIGLLIL